MRWTSAREWYCGLPSPCFGIRSAGVVKFRIPIFLAMLLSENPFLDIALINHQGPTLSLSDSSLRICASASDPKKSFSMLLASFTQCGSENTHRVQMLAVLHLLIRIVSSPPNVVSIMGEKLWKANAGSSNAAASRMLLPQRLMPDRPK